MKAFVPSILVTLAVALSASGCRPKSAAANNALSAPPGEAWIGTETVTSANIAVEPTTEHEVGTAVVTSARLTFDDAHVTHVFTPVSGRVVKIEAQLGQHVKKGDPLVTIQSPDIGQASSDLGKAQADYVAAEHDVKRKRDLHEAHAGSQADLEVAEDNFGKARAEMERAKQKAALLRAGAIDTVSQSYVLRSLMEGEVLMRNVNPGAEVQGQYGGGTAVELFTIGTLDPVWALADVFQVDLARVKRGTKVALSVVTYSDKTFEGTVDWVSELIDPATRTAKVRCTLPNPEHLLKPEMYATANIVTSGHRVLAVKRSAVLHIGEQQVVYVQTGNAPNGAIKFERRPIRVDEDIPGDYVPVQNGLTPGELVVTKNATLVSES